MADKQNKNLIIGICVAAVVVIAVIVGIVLIKGRGDDVIESDTGNNAGQIDTGAEGSEFSHIDVMVGYEDYDMMLEQSKAIQNGEMLGKVIQIDGIVSHPMKNYSIGQKDENGSFIGTEFVIEDASEENYPIDGDHVVITGEVIEKSPMYFVIRTTLQNVVLLERGDEMDDEVEYDDGEIEYDDEEVEIED